MDAGIASLLEAQAEAERQLVAVAAELNAGTTVLQTLALASTRLKSAGFRPSGAVDLIDGYAHLLDHSALRRLIREYLALTSELKLKEATHPLGTD
jgi:hypothetical protein